MTDLLTRLRGGADAVEPNAEHASEPLSADALALVDAAREAAAHIEALTSALEAITAYDDPNGDASKFGFGGLSKAQRIARTALTAPSMKENEDETLHSLSPRRA